MINRNTTTRYSGDKLRIPAVSVTVYREAMDANAVIDESRPTPACRGCTQSDLVATHCGASDTKTVRRDISTVLIRAGVPQRDGRLS